MKKFFGEWALVVFSVLLKVSIFRLRMWSVPQMTASSPAVAFWMEARS